MLMKRVINELWGNQVCYVCFLFFLQEHIPDNIPSERHRAVFYRRELAISNKYLLQSSLHQTKFLAFEPNENDQTLSKLVLHEKAEDQVDECAEVSIIS